MNDAFIIDSLERFPAVLCALIEPLPDAAFGVRGPGGGWSITEVLCHLVDEEVEDFRARVQSTLADPAAAWAPIDPEGAARDRAYHEQDARAALGRFCHERAASVGWLRSLRGIDWKQAHPHPRFGPVTAGTVLASWAAHDLLHLRQITKRLVEAVGEAGSPHLIDYAGEWTA